MPEVVHIPLWEDDFIFGRQDDLNLMCILVLHCVSAQHSQLLCLP